MSDFWDVVKSIREATKDTPGKLAEQLIDYLVSSGLQHVMEFHQWFGSLMDRANTFELWNAVDVIECGCSESCFHDFRAWLILQGQEAYDKALTDPEWLAERVELDTVFTDEGLQGVAIYAYERITGNQLMMPSGNTGVKGVDLAYTDETRDAVLKASYPKLYAKFGNCERWDVI